MPIAVNLSPRQLREQRFIDELRQVIAVDLHAAAGLELEITEGVIMEDINHSIASLQAIRAMGITIAIDDFGTGFSSLSYLAKLPIDTLKIDRSFVTEMTAAPERLALVSTIIGLAHSLKLKVVAEGVETEEQRRLLRLLSCDEMQGVPLQQGRCLSRFSRPGSSRPQPTANEPRRHPGSALARFQAGAAPAPLRRRRAGLCARDRDGSGGLGV